MFPALVVMLAVWLEHGDSAEYFRYAYVSGGECFWQVVLVADWLGMVIM